MALRDNLKRIREGRHLTGKELANALGIQYGTYMTYEAPTQGKSRWPSEENLLKIAAALHVSVDDLLGYKVDEYENRAASLMSFGFDLVENDDDSIDILQTEKDDFTTCICRYRNRSEFVLDMERAEWRYNKATRNNKALFLDMYFHTDVDEQGFKEVPPRKDAQKKDATKE